MPLPWDLNDKLQSVRLECDLIELQWLAQMPPHCPVHAPCLPEWEAEELDLAVDSLRAVRRSWQG